MIASVRIPPLRSVTTASRSIGRCLAARVVGAAPDDFVFVGPVEQPEARPAPFRAILDLPALLKSATGPAEGQPFTSAEIVAPIAAQAGNAVLYDRTRCRFDELCSTLL